MKPAVLFAVSAFLFSASLAKMPDTMFVATPLTPVHSFTEGIEGPAVDARGNIYAVNYARQQTIGKVSPDGAGEVFLTLPGKSTGNGIRFNRQGDMFIADYVEHAIYKVASGHNTPIVHAREDRMSQPNDIAITAQGVLYASDPDWAHGTGRVWRIDLDGKVKLVAEHMGTTNGIEVSPDGNTLYVNESVQRAVWAFTIAPDGSLHDKRLVIQFVDFGLDGMRVDVEGNLYVTRHGKGTVVKLTPTGNILQEIDVLGAMPSNICFGGPDGRTAYVTEVEKGRLVQFRIDSPGLEWERSRPISSN